MTDDLTKVVEDSARGGFFLFSGTAVATVVMSIGTMLVMRLLGSEVYGQYTLVLSIPQLLFLFTDLGISTGITRFTASLRTKGETNRIAAIVKHGLLLRTLVGAAIFLVSYAFADFFASLYPQGSELAFYMRIASIAVLFQAIFTTATSAFVGLDKSEFSAFSTNIQAFSKTLIDIILVLLGFGLLGIVVAHAASFGFAAIIGVPILFLLLRRKQDCPEDKTGFRKNIDTLMRYGAPVYISVLLVGFVPLYENIVIGVFTTTAEVGNYKAATNFITFMAVLSTPIITTLLPAFSKLDSSVKQGTRTFFRLANKYATIVMMPVTVLMIALSSEVINLTNGPTYNSAPSFLAVFCLQFFLVGLGSLTLTSFYNGLGETRTTMKMSAVTFTIVLFLCPILTVEYGAAGSIIGFLIASSASTVYGAYIARKRFQVEFGAHSVVRVYLIAALSSIPTLLLLRSVDLSSLVGPPFQSILQPLFQFLHQLPLLPTFVTALSDLAEIAIGGCVYLFCYVTLMPLTKVMTSVEIHATMRITDRIPGLSFVARTLLKYQLKILKAIGEAGQ